MLMDDLQKKEILVLILCLVVGFALRFYTFDRKSLWTDEIYTFNESRYGLQDQFTHYKENPTYLQPPVFYLLTHLFYPFTKPERDLRIIPLIFGTLSIPMIYLLSRLFSPAVGLPCTLSLTFMAYHISLSQDGRSYSLLLFLGMAGLYFLIKHVKTSRKRYLIPAAISFALSFYTNYAFTPFIALFQLFWFYRTDEEGKKPVFKSILFFNGLLLLFCFSWVLFAALSYTGQSFIDPLRKDGGLDSVWKIVYNTFRDWTPNVPVTILSILLLFLLPLFSKIKRNAFILLGTFVISTGGSYLFFKLFNITHYITSRYLLNLLPLFLISIYMSLHNVELRFERYKRYLRFGLFFIVLFIASNLVILPFYYRAEKQDFRGLVEYLKNHLKEGDKIFDGDRTYTPGILHYFGIYPEGRHHVVHFKKTQEKMIELKKSFLFRDHIVTIYSSSICCSQYTEDGSRLWVVVGKEGAKEVQRNLPCSLKGYFDGSFLNFKRFPTDASMYLFLLDPKSPDERGIDIHSTDE